MAFGIIYLVTNKTTGKRYVGQTRQSLAKRWGEHLHSNSVKYLHRAIEKYGKDDFIVEQIAEAETQEELDALEISYTQEYGTLAPDGYNLCIGPPGHEMTEATKQKIAETLLGVSHTEERRNNQRLAAIRSGRTKRVICLETGEVYDSIAEASRRTGANEDAIRKVLHDFRNQVYTAGGFHWCYADDPKTIDEIEACRKKVDAPVWCYETGEHFQTIADAAKKMNIPTASISQVVLGKNKTAYGYHFLREGEEYDERNYRVTPHNRRHAKPVICIETGERFESAKDAGAANGVTGGAIENACRMGTKSVGRHWKYE